MNNYEKKASVSRLTKKIIARFLRACILYTIILLLLFVAVNLFFSRFVWYEDDLIYRILHPVKELSPFWLPLIWGIGIILIFVKYWHVTLGYIDMIVDATNQMVDGQDELIHLPDELDFVEDKMNTIKHEALQNARAAKEAEQRKNDLIVYLAHDLKTPLTSVIGYLTLLHDEPQISDPLKEKYVNISLEKAQRLEDLINEFFEITRFNLSHLTLELEDINLSRMLEQIVYEFYPVFAEKNLRCELNMEPNLMLRCDVDKLERVFDNLFKNAVNYSYENSEIRVTVIRKPESIYISVLNHGRTIPKEKLERIFEQFYRLDSARTTKNGGAGLGLAIAKEIVELHHGRISAVSENDTIEFDLELPIQL